MPTNEDVLKAYLVSIGYKIDADSYKKFKDNNEDQKKRLEDLKKKHEAFVEGFKELSVKALAAATALGAGIITVADKMEKLYFASQRTGASAANIRSLKFAAEQVGVSAEDAQSAVENLARSVRLNPGLQGYLKALSINPDQDRVQVLMDMVDKLSKLPFYQASQIAGQFGIDDQTLYMLEKNRTELEKYLEQYKKLNAGTDEQAAKSHEFNQNLRNLENKFATLGNLMATSFMPLMERLTVQLEKIVGFFIDADKATGGWSSRLLGLGTAIGGVVGSLAVLRGAGGILARLLGISTAGAAAGGATAGTAGTAAGAAGTAVTAGGGAAAGLLGAAGVGLAAGGLEAWIFKRLIGDNTIRTSASNESMHGFAQAMAGGRMVLGGKMYRRVQNGAGFQWIAEDQLRAKDGAQNADPYGGFIRAAAAKYNVSEELLRGIMRQESDNNPMATSKKGAFGLMQLMPGTAKQLGVDATKPDQNIMGGAHLISDLLKRYHGDTRLALAAYNAGAGAVNKYGGVPPFAETQDYVKKITGRLTGDGQLAARAGLQFTQSTNIYVNGADARSTGDAVADSQRRVNGDLIRNLAGVVQ